MLLVFFIVTRPNPDRIRDMIVDVRLDGFHGTPRIPSGRCRILLVRGR